MACRKDNCLLPHIHNIHFLLQIENFCFHSFGFLSFCFFIPHLWVLFLLPFCFFSVLFHISCLFEVRKLLLDLLLFKHSFLHNSHSLQLSIKLFHHVYLVFNWNLYAQLWTILFMGSCKTVLWGYDCASNSSLQCIFDKIAILLPLFKYLCLNLYSLCFLWQKLGYIFG